MSGACFYYNSNITVSSFAMYKAFPCSDYYGLIWLPKGHRSLCFWLSYPTISYGTPLDLSSSQYISSYMPRLNNSADSPQPNQIGCFVWTSMALQTSSVRPKIYRSDTSTSGPRQPLWPIWSSVYASPILFAWCSPHCWKAIANLTLRQRRNTRYGWLVKPYPTGTCTLQDALSLAWRTNASLRG